MAQATSRQLDEAERKVAEALGLAADMSDQLAAHVQLAPDGARAETEAACRRTQQQFLQLVREIRAAMVEASAGARNFRPICRSMYSAQTDGSIGGRNGCLDAILHVAGAPHECESDRPCARRSHRIWVRGVILRTCYACVM